MSANVRVVLIGGVVTVTESPIALPLKAVTAVLCAAPENVRRKTKAAADALATRTEPFVFPFVIVRICIRGMFYANPYKDD